MVRVENERLQAMGIMAAAERARVAAQKKIFEIEAAERAEAERLSAQHAAEEARKAAHTRDAEGLDARNARRADSTENGIASGIRSMSPGSAGRTGNAYLHESRLHEQDESAVTSHPFAVGGGNVRQPQQPSSEDDHETDHEAALSAAAAAASEAADAYAHSLAEEERESAAIDRALDSLDALIKA